MRLSRLFTGAGYLCAQASQVIETAHAPVRTRACQCSDLFFNAFLMGPLWPYNSPETLLMIQKGNNGTDLMAHPPH